MAKSYVDKCALCSRASKGREYLFYYGNLGKIDVQGTTTGQIITEEYFVAGESHAFICDICVKRQRRKFSQGLLFTVMLALLTILIYNFGYVILSIIVGVCAFIALGIYLETVNGLEFYEAGNQLAMRSQRRQYELRGYKTLLTPKEKKRLKPSDNRRDIG